jgi:hypothetical protein
MSGAWARGAYRVRRRSRGATLDPAGNQRAGYIAPGETLLRETLGAPWFYLHGPAFTLLAVLSFDYVV